MTSPLPNTSLHFLDFIIVILYIVIVLSIGWWYSLRQENAKSYFLGSGNINSFFVGISLYVTLFSTTSYLAIPGEIIKHGPAVLFGVISVPFSYAVISYILIPTLMKNRVVSAYELLDDKLGITCRRISACLFIFLRIIWMAVMMYLAATAISVILGMGPRSIIWIIIITGIISIAYTSIGGLQAVVITDFLQFVVLFGGAVCTIVGVTIHLRGFNWIPTQWSSDWDVQPIFSLNPTVRATLFGAFLMQFLYFICSSGSDQTQIQRYMATTNVRAARNAVLIKSIASVMTTAIIGATGFAILGFYQSFPEALPTGKTVNNFADSLFPFFITSQLPSGIAGFVVSALLAAAMSSVDSGVNSITAVVMRDLLPPQWRNKFSTLKQKKLQYISL